MSYNKIIHANSFTVSVTHWSSKKHLLLEAVNANLGTKCMTQHDILSLNFLILP